MFQWVGEKLNVKNLGEILAPSLSPEQELHKALEDGLLDKAQLLVEERGVDHNALSNAGNIPMHTAAYYGRDSFIDYLLMRGVDVNARGARENTPMHYAAAQGKFQTVKLLVSRGGNPALKNDSGRTPYDVAVGDNLRQYLLPLQFQREDPAEAARVLGTLASMGITPTREISSGPVAPPPVIPPPPAGGYPGMHQSTSPLSGPPGMVIPPPPPAGVPYAPQMAGMNSAGKRLDPKIFRPIKADGFGTTVGNPELSAKYGNQNIVKEVAPPPPMMGPPGATSPPHAAVPVPQSAPTLPVAAPQYPTFAAPGANPYARGRYTTYDPHTNSGQAFVPTVQAHGGDQQSPSLPQPPMVARPNVQIFNPIQGQGGALSQVNTPSHPAPVQVTPPGSQGSQGSVKGFAPPPVLPQQAIPGPPGPFATPPPRPVSSHAPVASTGQPSSVSNSFTEAGSPPTPSALDQMETIDLSAPGSSVIS